MARHQSTSPQGVRRASAGHPKGIRRGWTRSPGPSPFRRGREFRELSALAWNAGTWQGRALPRAPELILSIPGRLMESGANEQLL